MDQLLIDGTDGALPSRTLSSLLSSSATILSIRPPLVFPSTSSSRYCLPLLCFAFVAFRCLSCKFPPGKSVQAGGTMMHDDRGESEFGRSAQVQIRFLRVFLLGNEVLIFFSAKAEPNEGESIITWCSPARVPRAVPLPPPSAGVRACAEAPMPPTAPRPAKPGTGNPATSAPAARSPKALP